MCGIAGIIGPNNNQFSISSMLERIKHRGPDGLFYWDSNNINLAHARLSIIDLSTDANQPMIDEETGNVIVFNGEIYNYIELKEELKNKYNFKTQSDTEVLLATYRIFGLDMFAKLRGMFAFALFDPKLNKVLLARDRLGIKPLIYRKIDNTILFASEIKSLINQGATEKVNELKVYEFLADARMDADEHTLFEGVKHLLPAHYMWVGLNGESSEPKSFWDFPELGNRRFDENARLELIETMDENIKIHLRSDVPVGTFLSGGLDSSTATVFALKNMKQEKLNVFSAILPYFHPENSLINEITDSDNRIIKNDLLLSNDDFFEDIPKVIYQNGSPILDGSMYTHYKLCKLAKDKNIKVLLSGSGGDELFGGYESMVNAQHARLLYQRRFIKYFTEQNLKLAYRTESKKRFEKIIWTEQNR
jgi:asparagine synthase (glutamine-hydrolysing)